MFFLCIFSLLLTSSLSALCSTYNCPTGYIAKTDTALTCAVDPCTDADRDTCCDAKVQCSTYSCPAGSDSIDNANCTSADHASCTDTLCCGQGCDARVCVGDEKKFKHPTCADDSNCQHWECCSECNENALTTLAEFDVLVKSDVTNCYEFFQVVPHPWCSYTLRQVGVQKFGLDDSDGSAFANITNLDHKVYRTCPNSCEYCEEHKEDYTEHLFVALAMYAILLSCMIVYFIIVEKPDNNDIDKKMDNPERNSYEQVHRDEFGIKTKPEPSKLDKPKGKIGVEVEASRY